MTGDDLLAAVYAAPDDDAPRAVYADWLQERGDPLGELIALQLAPRTPKSLRREATLIKAHREAWLGPLWHVVNRVHLTFERGFPSRVRLRPKVSAARLIEGIDRRWATVRELDLWGLAYGDLVLSEVMRGLHILRSVPPPLAISMLRDGRPRSLRELEIQGDTTWQSQLRPALQSSRLPELRHFELRLARGDDGPDALGWLWDSPLGTRLESFALPQAGSPSPAWRTSTVVPPNITAVYFGEGPLDVTTLRRGPSGLLDQLEEPAR